MATVIDSLLVTLGVDAAGVAQGMDAAESRIEGGVKKLTRLLAPVVGLAALKSAVSSYTATADSLGKLADSLSLGVSELDAWGDAAAHAGGSAAGFQGSLKSLNRKIVDASVFGKKLSQEVFKEFGISASDAAGKARPATDVLVELAGAAETMDKSKFSAMAQRLGLDQGTIALLQSGRAEVSKLVGEMKGLAYTRRDAEVAAAYNDVMQDLGKVVKIATASFLRYLVPVLTKVADILKKGINFLRKHEPFVIGVLASITAALLKMLLPALLKVSAAVGGIMLPFLPLIALVGVLGLLFDDFWNYVNGGKSKLGGLWAVFGTGEEIAAALSDAWVWLKSTGVNLWNTLRDAAQKFFGYFKPALGNLFGAFKGVFKLIRAVFQGDFQGMFDAASEIFSNLGGLALNVFTGAFNLLYDIFSIIFSNIANFFGGILDSILGHVSSFIRGIVSKIPDFLLPDSIIAWAKKADEAVAVAGANAANVMSGNAPGAAGNAAEGVGSLAGGVDNSSETVVNVQKIEVVAPSGDPQAIASATGSEIRKLANSSNQGVRQ